MCGEVKNKTKWDCADNTDPNQHSTGKEEEGGGRYVNGGERPKEGEWEESVREERKLKAGQKKKNGKNDMTFE